MKFSLYKDYIKQMVHNLYSDYDLTHFKKRTYPYLGVYMGRTRVFFIKEGVGLCVDGDNKSELGRLGKDRWNEWGFFPTKIDGSLKTLLLNLCKSKKNFNKVMWN